MSKTQINVLLTPHWQKDKISKVNIKINTDISLKGGDSFFSIYKRVTNKSFTKIEGKITISDEKGSFSFQTSQEESPHTLIEKYHPQRDSAGIVLIEYTALLSPVKRNPGFDLGYEDNGMTGSGMTFLPLFDCDECEIMLDWDLKFMPKGCSGVCSFGEGKSKVFGASSILQESFYTAGKVQSATSGSFGFYWLENKVFDASEIAQWAKITYEKMSKFFKDKNNSYRIFARKVEEDKFGGTALENSYLFVYPPDKLPTVAGIKFLFAHEMVHNWIKMNDNPFGTLTWYVEGMAEYYSALLLWKYNFVTKEELVSELNERSKKYYENPHISIKNEGAGNLLFSNREATLVPYGRGFFYMAETDAKIRKSTRDEKSLEDVMFTLKNKMNNGENPGVDAWLNELVPIIGAQAEKDYESMKNGRTIAPNLICFGESIKSYKKTGTVRETDKACDLWVFE